MAKIRLTVIVDNEEGNKLLNVEIPIEGVLPASLDTAIEVDRDLVMQKLKQKVSAELRQLAQHIVFEDNPQPLPSAPERNTRKKKD